MPISLVLNGMITSEGMLMMNSVNGGGVPETGEVTSVCLMRAGSFVNHSDDPCCAILPNRDGYSNIAFIALREIAPGEEVTISYVDPSLTLDEMDKLLATQYFILPQRGRKDDSHSSKIAKFRAKAKTEKAMAKAMSAAEEMPRAPEATAHTDLQPSAAEDGKDDEEAATLVIEAGAPSKEPIDLEEHELQSEAERLKAEMARLKLENESLKGKLKQ